MTTTTAPKNLIDISHEIERHWNELAREKRLYSIGGFVIFLSALLGSLWFANDANSGKFFDRLPYLLDFLQDLVPDDWREVWRALFDLQSPFDDGSQKYNYPEGRHFLTDSFYIPEYVFKVVETLNIALLSTFIGLFFGFGLAFLAARNMMPNPWVRGFSRRIMELFRAFPEVVLAGFFLAVFSLGPIPAIIAVSIHTVGALGKLYYEVVENADMKPIEGLRAVGANWIERVWFGMVPQVMPNFISYFLMRFEINVRASTIIGAVGGGGIGELLRLSISQGHEAKTLAIVGLLLVTVICVDQFSAWLRGRLTGAQPNSQH